MTKEQFEEIVRAQMKQVFAVQGIARMHDDASRRFERAIERIVEQWESDVNDARIAGQDEGVQSNYMEGDTSSHHCMGPCCGGSIS